MIHSTTINASLEELNPNLTGLSRSSWDWWLGWRQHDCCLGNLAPKRSLWVLCPLNHWKRWLCTLCEGSVLYHRWSWGCAQKPWGPRGWHLEVSVGSLNSRCRKMVWHGNVQVVSVVPSRCFVFVWGHHVRNLRETSWDWMLLVPANLSVPSSQAIFCVVKLWQYHNTFSWNSRLRHWEVLLNIYVGLCGYISVAMFGFALTNWNLHFDGDQELQSSFQSSFWSLSASLSHNPKCVEGTWRAIWVRQQDGHGCFQRCFAQKSAEVENYMQLTTINILQICLAFVANFGMECFRRARFSSSLQACLSQMFHWQLHVRVEWWSLTCRVESFCS